MRNIHLCSFFVVLGVVQPPASPSNALAGNRFFELLETRTLLSAGGPLTVVITELNTSPLEQVTIVDNGPSDTSSAIGVITYSTPVPSFGNPTPDPFSDFAITGMQVTSNRTATPTPTSATLIQTGTVTRTTGTAGNHTLEIQVEDYNYLFPATETTLLNTANVTFTNGTAGSDQSQFQSAYNATPSPIVSSVSTGGSTNSKNGTSPPTSVSGIAPFNLSNTINITLAPNLGSGGSATQFRYTGESVVVGTNASLAGNVYLDNNADGVLDTGDSPIGSVTVTLTGTDANGDVIDETTTTAANGTYDFTNLTTGTYTVTETPPAGYIQGSTTPGVPTDGVSTPPGQSPASTSSIVINGGQSLTNYNFGELLPVSLNGTDYLVSNTTPAGSLTTSSTGIPIPGTTVTLTGVNANNMAVSETTTTNATGQYSFTGLIPSNASGYTVTETPPSADTHLGQTSTTSGAVTTPAATPVVSNIVLNDSDSPSTDNFFETPAVSVNGTDYLVSNTTLAGDLTTSTTGTAIAGTTVTITGTDEFGGTVNATTTTDANGDYSFTGLNPSNASGYTVTETPPASDTHLGQTSTTTGAVTTPAATPVVSNIVLPSSGDSSTDNYFETATDTITGTDYLVSNTTLANGLTTTTTGNPIPGTTVTLTGTDEFGNPVSETTTTDANGDYSFTGLNPSNSSGYTVTETPPATDSHLGQTSTTTGAVTTPASTPVVSNIVLSTGGETSTDNYFETIAVSVNGVDNLVSNTTPAGSLTTSTTGLAIAGTTVTLSGTDAFGDTVSATATTDANGAYSFTGLNPSNASGYTVTETPPASDTHLGQTSTTSGAVTTPAATPVVSNIVLTTNGASSTDNYFETPAVSVNGTDYLVSNTTLASGLTTSTTGLAIAGTTVTITGTDEFGGTVNATTTTDASGDYSFTGLNPSNASGYTVTETPAGQRHPPGPDLDHDGRGHDPGLDAGGLPHRLADERRQQHRQLLRDGHRHDHRHRLPGVEHDLTERPDHDDHGQPDPRHHGHADRHRRVRQPGQRDGDHQRQRQL